MTHNTQVAKPFALYEPGTSSAIGKLDRRIGSPTFPESVRGIGIGLSSLIGVLGCCHDARQDILLWQSREEM